METRSTARKEAELIQAEAQRTKIQISEGRTRFRKHKRKQNLYRKKTLKHKHMLTEHKNKQNNYAQACEA